MMNVSEFYLAPMKSVSRLAHAAALTRWQDLATEVQAQVSDLFLDTLGVISAGLAHPEYAPFARVHGGVPGTASVPGVDHGVPTLDAILVNGGATTVLQLQDGHRLARGHPASHIVPALLAIAEEESAGATAVLKAFVAGYEVGTRVGIALDGINPALHDTGTWGSIATAVAVAHLLSRGDADVIGAAIEASAAVALMPYRDTAARGATVHHTYVGLGSLAGIAAARAAVAGLSPLDGTLDRFFGPRAGAAYKPEKLLHGIDENGTWASYELMRAYIKVHPTCAHLHGVNDAVDQLIQDYALGADDVAWIDVSIYAAALEFDNPRPANDLAARFSIAATVAIAVSRGELTTQTLTDKVLRSPDVQALMERVHVSHDPKLDKSYPDGRPCQVHVTCVDGRGLTAAVTHPLGDCTNPLAREARRAKAVSLLAERLGERAAQEVAEAWDAAVGGCSLSTLSEALRAPAVK